MSGETVIQGVILLCLAIWVVRRVRQELFFFTDRNRYEVIRANQRNAKDAQFAASAPYVIAGVACIFLFPLAAPFLLFIALVVGWLARVGYRG